MNISRKIGIIIELYLRGEIDKEDYIRLRKGVKPSTLKLHKAIRDMRKQDK